MAGCNGIVGNSFLFRPILYSPRECFTEKGTQIPPFKKMSTHLSDLQDPSNFVCFLELNAAS